MPVQTAVKPKSPTVLFRKQKEKLEPVLTQSLTPVAYSLISSGALASIPKGDLMNIAAEIAKNTADSTFLSIGRIQDTSQISHVLADSLTQSIVNNSHFQSDQANVGQIYQRAIAQVAKVVSDDYKNLETAAVLGNLSQIENLDSQNEELREMVIEESDNFIESNHPLAAEKDHQKEYGKVAGVLQNYQEELTKSVTSKIDQDNVPTFDELQQAKEQAFEKSASNINGDGQTPNSIDSKGLVDHIGYLTGIKPLNTGAAQNLGLGNTQPNITTFTYKSGLNFGVGLSMSTSKEFQNQANDVLLAQDTQKLENSLKKQASVIDRFKSKPSLNFKERLAMTVAQKRYQKLLHIRAVPANKQNMRNKILTYFQKSSGPLRLENSSRIAWQTYRIYNNDYPGIWVPQSPSYDEYYQPQRLVSAMSANSGNYTRIGSPVVMLKNSIGSARSAFSGVKSAIGAAKSTASAIKTAKTIAQTGALIAETSNPVGWAMLAMKLKPFVDKFKKVFRKILFVAGALAAYLFLMFAIKIAGALSGFAIGAVTGLPLLAVPGVGPFLYVGYVSAWTVYGWTHPLQTIYLITHPLAPVYAIGNYIGGFFSGAGGALGTAGSFVTGSASALWGGASSLASSALGGLSSAASAIWNGITSISFSTSAIATPVLAGFGSLVTLAIGTQIVTATSFFNNKADQLEGSGPPPAAMQFVDASKLVSSTNPAQGPSTSVSIGNNNLPQLLNYDVKITAKNKVSGLNCTDKLTLLKKDGTTEDISNLLPALLPPAPVSCNNLDTGGILSFSFPVSLPSESRFNDSIVINKFSLSGSGQSTATTSNLDYNIPFRDSGVQVVNESALKTQVANNPGWQPNLVNTDCDPGVSCWDYVKNVARTSGVNPAFILAVWIAESGASHFPGHLSCPNGGLGLDPGVAGLKVSVDCFVNGTPPFPGAANFPADQFAQMLDAFCDPSTPEICQEPPAPVKTFVASLKSWYNNLVPPGSPGAMTSINVSGATTTIPFSADAVAYVSIGSPPNNCPHGWPTIGNINQGPEGPYSHADNPTGPYGGGYEALDIGNGVVGNSVFATLDGEVVESRVDSDNLNQRVTIQPTGCPLLNYVYFLHMSARYVKTGDIVHWGQEIGQSGQAGTGPHVHYQFNEPFNRSFSVSDSPHVPTSIKPRDCIEITNPCGVIITNAP